MATELPLKPQHRAYDSVGSLYSIAALGGPGGSRRLPADPAARAGHPALGALFRRADLRGGVELAGDRGDCRSERAGGERGVDQTSSPWMATAFHGAIASAGDFRRLRDLSRSGRRRVFALADGSGGDRLLRRKQRGTGDVRLAPAGRGNNLSSGRFRITSPAAARPAC